MPRRTNTTLSDKSHSPTEELHMYVQELRELTAEASFTLYVPQES